MGIPERGTKMNKLGKFLTLLLLTIFPFGQLLRVNLHLEELRVVIVFLDILAGLITFLVLIRKRSNIYTYLRNPEALLVVAFFSLLISISYVGLRGSLFGGLYLIRTVSYVGLFVYVRDYFSNSEKNRQILYSGLILATLAISVLGLVQYLLIPDLRNLVQWGWDGHWYRLAGTFLDPGYTGLLLVFGFFLSFSRYCKTKKRSALLLSIIVLVCISLTYSRASYLALLGGIMVLLGFVRAKMKGLLIVFAIVFVATLPLLPRPAGVGVQLERTHSVHSRFDNYKETINIWQISPVFGVGFNTTCQVKRQVLGFDNVGLNSCSGSDSSLLLILATTGVSGLMVFLSRFISGFTSLFQQKESTLMAVAVALLIHSFFSNSLFYPWVMAWVAMQAGLAFGCSTRKK